MTSSQTEGSAEPAGLSGVHRLLAKHKEISAVEKADLERLLDRVFSLENPPQDSALDTMVELVEPTIERMKQDEIFHLKSRINVLEAELAESYCALRQAKTQNRSMKLELASKDDQLKYVPELLRRATLTTLAEREASELRSEVEVLRRQSRVSHRSWWQILRAFVGAV